MKLLVTGKAGQVVQSLVERAEALGDVTVVTAGRPEFDLGAPASIAAIIAEARPDVLVSAAAYTAVDKAESDADEARRVNATGPGALAKA
ncbi:sugar nucleotide-binding protein, partial [Escherichia coli]|nr:sugar nucleotide-binding protein [Escherichia coli]